MRDDHVAQPEGALDVGAHDLVEGLVADGVRRAIDRVGRGVADQHVDAAKGSQGAINQILQLGLVAHMAGNRQRIEALTAQLVRNLLTNVGLAAGNHHLGAGPGVLLGNRLADALGRTGDDGDFTG